MYNILMKLIHVYVAITHTVYAYTNYTWSNACNNSVCELAREASNGGLHRGF